MRQHSRGPANNMSTHEEGLRKLRESMRGGHSTGWLRGGKDRANRNMWTPIPNHRMIEAERRMPAAERLEAAAGILPTPSTSMRSEKQGSATVEAALRTCGHMRVNPCLTHILVRKDMAWNEVWCVWEDVRAIRLLRTARWQMLPG